MRLTLNETASSRFGADGAARVTIGPRGTDQNWRIARLITTTDSTSETTLKVYQDFESPSTLVDASKRANQDTDEITNKLVLSNLNRLVFVWENGTPNTEARISIVGEIF